MLIEPCSLPKVHKYATPQLQHDSANNSDSPDGGTEEKRGTDNGKAGDKGSNEDSDDESDEENDEETGEESGEESSEEESRDEDENAEGWFLSSRLNCKSK